MTADPRPVSDAEAVRIMARTIAANARRLGARGWDVVDDLEQEGRVGAMEAAKTFDPARGLKFITHATFRVRGRMLDYLREHCDHLSRVARGRVAAGGAEPYRVVSLHGKRPDDHDPNADRDGRYRLDPAHHDPAPCDGAEAEFAAFVRRTWPGATTPGERALLASYFVRGRTVRDIARGLGVSESRASQKLAAVLRALGGAGGVRAGGHARRGTGRRPVLAAATLAALGVTGYRVERAGGKRQYLFACRCGGERRATNGHLHYWRRLGRLPACRGGCERPGGVPA